MRYVLVSITSGFLFGIMDGLINANRLAQSLFEVYKPIARSGINIPAGIAIDILYGFVMAGAFLLLHKCLPGKTRILKGVSFACMVWFFRVVMATASQWMILPLSAKTVLYMLVTGLLEMLVLGLIYSLTLSPKIQKLNLN